MSRFLLIELRDEWASSSTFWNNHAHRRPGALARVFACNTKIPRLTLDILGLSREHPAGGGRSPSRILLEAVSAAFVQMEAL